MLTASEPSHADSAPRTRSHAEAGDAEAQFGLALYLVCGPSPDYPEAAKWYLKAAEQNHRLAQLNLGRMLAAGHGLEQDGAAAATWIGRAAEGGDAGAQFEMGDRCSRANAHGGDMRAGDLRRSRIECYKWFKLAASQGYRGAENRADFATLEMTCEEVAAGEQLVAEFVPA